MNAANSTLSIFASINMAALEYVAAGFSLVPIPSGLKGPTNAGWNLQENCVNTVDQCSRIKGNIGLAHTYSGTCVLDFEDFQKSAEWLKQQGIAMADLWNAADAVRISSGRENRGKLLYRLPPGTKTLKHHNLQQSGIELRCATASGLTVQDVLPPSIHPETGNAYTWEYSDPAVGNWRNPPVLPPAVFEVWKRLDTSNATFVADAEPMGLTDQNLSEILHSLDADLPYDQWLKVGMGLHHETRGEGFDLWDAWSSAGSTYPGEEKLRAHWNSFGQRADVAYVTAGSLLKLAAENGKRISIDCSSEFDILPADPERISANGPLAPAACDVSDVRNGTRTTHPMTEMGNALRLFDICGDRVRYVSDVQKWLLWDQGAWIYDSDGAALRRIAGGLAARIYQEGTQYWADGKKFASHSRASQTNKSINNAVTLLADFKQVRISINRVDADSMLVGFDSARQVIDLSTGTIRPSTQNDYVTKSLGVERIGDAASAMQWMTFLDQVFCGDKALISWLQRFCGYMLTGETREHIFLFCYGSGSNGKSVFLEILKHIMGDYGRAIGSETLCESKRQAGSASPDLAVLIGARLGVCGETAEGAAFASSLIKGLVAGDVMPVRQLYKESVELKPQFKLLIAGNHKPQVRGHDHGMWRRVRLVPFTRSFSGSEKDTALDKKLKVEAPHILAWMVKGAIEWQKYGLVESPAVIREATAEYQEEQDLLTPWFDECIVADANAATSIHQLYENYKTWAHRDGLKPMTKISLGKRLAEKGFIEVRTNSSRMRNGLRLQEPDPGI